MKPLIVVDLEATCWEDGTPREESEVIEIGAVFMHPPLVVGKPWQIGTSFDTLIQPVRHPRLSDFCTQLTTITQKQVDEAPKFPEAWAAFEAWLKTVDPVGDSRMVAWGGYDHSMLRRECARHGTKMPWQDAVNLKEVFATQSRRKGGSRKQLGLRKALDKLNIPFEGTPHRGIDDAKMTAKIAEWLFQSSRWTPSLQAVSLLCTRSTMGIVAPIEVLEAEARDMQVPEIIPKI